MLETILKAIEALRVPTTIVSAVVVASGALLLAQPSELSWLGLNVLAVENRGYIGAVFLLCCALVVTRAAAHLWKFIKPWIVEFIVIRRGRKRLMELNPDEKSVLRYFLENKTRAQTLNYVDGLTRSLERDHIISRASTLARAGTHFDYIIQPWVWDAINDDPHLLD